jgi:hypothetical protein
MLVIIVYNGLSSSAKELVQFKGFFIFLETEYSVLLCQILTRFLGLFAAVDRLLKN